MKETDIFDLPGNLEPGGFQPLAYRMRPDTLDLFLGQEHVAGEGAILERAILNDNLFSMILWGPPGCGKTTLANIIARETKSHFIEISAVLSGVKEIKDVIKNARDRKRIHRRRTILFVDEIHRFNKAQQDAFLPHVENGTIILVGATTENPSFEVIPALVSRCRVITLKPLSIPDIKTILKRALMDPHRGLGYMNLVCTEPALELIASFADGDVRSALSSLESAALFVSSGTGHGQGMPDPSSSGSPSPDVSSLKSPSIGIENIIHVGHVEKCLQKKALIYDKTGEGHYNLISAFHKSMRGSDPDAAIYWLFRMLMAGEDPYYILRRMVRFATEDVGMADPGALSAALNALESFRFLGHPEGDDAIAQAAVYLATAPKSNSVYRAVKKVREKIGETGSLEVPMHLRNAPTKMMKQMGYAEGYLYPHDYREGYIAQEYMPDELKGCKLYEPVNRGYEIRVIQMQETKGTGQPKVMK
ncbi:MAG: replication-associated recombination protein A [Desulfamplus sp.]|nr:replication-associated recombination protein A [Desulfamplus sp.]